MVVVGRALKEWERGTVVVMQDGEVVGRASAVRGLEAFLREREQAYAQDRRAHTPDIVLEGMDADLLRWIGTPSGEKHDFVVRDNRAQKFYSVRGFVTSLSDSRSQWAVDLVEPSDSLP